MVNTLSTLDTYALVSLVYDYDYAREWAVLLVEAGRQLREDG